MEVIKRYQIHIWLLFLIALGGYFLFAYELKRTDHLLLFASFAILFLTKTIRRCLTAINTEHR